jgi:hypothetical protein
MAEKRGGMRPTAPQNNPINISATGGAGQSGTQPARYMSGLAYGQGQAQMEQQTSAPMAANPVVTATPTSTMPQMPQITSFDEPTQYPDRPGTYGIDAGSGAGSEALTLPAMVPQQQPDSSAMLYRALYAQDPTNEDVRRALEYLGAEGRI